MFWKVALQRLQNGNKRVAVMTLLYFLFINKSWPSVGSKELYEFALDIAKSPREDKAIQVKKIAAFITRYWKKIK